MRKRKERKRKKSARDEWGSYSSKRSLKFRSFLHFQERKLNIGMKGDIFKITFNEIKIRKIDALFCITSSLLRKP